MTLNPQYVAGRGRFELRGGCTVKLQDCVAYQETGFVENHAASLPALLRGGFYVRDLGAWV